MSRRGERQSPGLSLSSCLDAGPAPDLYFSCNPDKLVEGLLAPTPRGIGTSRLEENPVMKHCVLTPDFEKRESAPPITISKHTQKKLAKVLAPYSSNIIYPLPPPSFHACPGNQRCHYWQQMVPYVSSSINTTTQE